MRRTQRRKNTHMTRCSAGPHQLTRIAPCSIGLLFFPRPRAPSNRAVSCPFALGRIASLRDGRSSALVTLAARRGVSLHLVSCANMMRGRGPFRLGARVRGAPCPPAREVTADTPGSWPGECHPVSGAQLVSKLMSTTTVTAYVSATNWRSMRYEARKIKGCKQKKNRPSSLRDGCW